MKLNLSILVVSFKYLNSSFNLIVSLSSWIYHELSLIKYKNYKLIKSFNYDDFKVVKSIIPLYNDADVYILNNLFITSYIYTETRLTRNIYKRLKILLEHHADVHNTDDQILRGSEDVNIIRLLLKHGANIHARNDEILRFSSYDGYVEVVKLLLDHGANVHANRDESLRYACNFNHIELVKLLLEHGANVNCDNGIALSIACYYGHIDVVKILLEYHIVVHLDHDMLRYANEKYNTEIVQLIKDYESKYSC